MSTHYAPAGAAPPCGTFPMPWLRYTSAHNAVTCERCRATYRYQDDAGEIVARAARLEARAAALRATVGRPIVRAQW
jgi:hypothetical protein